MTSDKADDDLRNFGMASEVDTNPGGSEPAELLGICFGDLVPNLPCVLIGLQVRLTSPEGVREGERPPIMIDFTTLGGLRDGLPALLTHMRSQGADVDRLAAPRVPVPAWNEGPRYTGPMDLRALCMGFGFFEETLPEKGAAIAYIELQDALRQEEVTGGRYIVPHRVLLELQQALPKVLRKMEQKGHNRTAPLH